MSIGILYIGLLAAGVVYALIAGALGWLGDVGHGFHLDAAGHADVSHPHPLSGTVVATFVTGFGGGGVVAHYVLHWGLLAGLGLALASGLVLATAAFLLMDWLFAQTQAGSEFASDLLVGREAEVITTIPADGTGEISYLVKGQRGFGPARTADGSAVPRGRPVVIERVVGSTHVVRLK
jgi:hypothetical protein